MATVNGNALLAGAGGQASNSFPGYVVNAVPVFAGGGVSAGTGTNSRLAGTITLPVINTAYTSIGTGPMLISPDSAVQLVIKSSQPTASTHWAIHWHSRMPGRFIFN